MSDAKSSESDLIQRIGELVTEEHALREQREHRLTSEERARIRDLEKALDQCWDLLRQRRAKEEYGQDPQEARVRPADQVEEYPQ